MNTKLDATGYGIERVAICTGHMYRTHAPCHDHGNDGLTYDYAVVRRGTYGAERTPYAETVYRSNGDALVYGNYSSAYSWITRNA